MGPRVLGGLIIVLILMTGGVVVVQRAQQPVRSVETVMAKVAIDQVTQLSLTASGATTTIKLIDGNWRVVAPFDDRAGADPVERLISSLINARLGSVLSSNPERYDRYDLTPTAATRLQVFVKGSESPAVDYWVGKGAESGGSSYVRVEGSREVRTAEGLPPEFLLRNPEDFRSTYVTPTDPDMMTRLVASGAVSVSIDASTVTWVNSDTKRILSGDQRQAAFLALRDWRAAGFTVNEPGAGQGLDKPFLELEITAGTSFVRVVVGKPVPGKIPVQRYVRVSDRPAILLVDDALTTAVIDALKPAR